MIEKILTIAEDILPTGDFIRFKEFIFNGKYHNARQITEYYRLEHKQMTGEDIISLDSLVTQMCLDNA